MKIALLDIPSARPECVNKDFMGGYGWAFHIGPSLRAKAIEKVKKSGEKVPLLEYAYLAAIFKQEKQEVFVAHDENAEADLYLLHASMVDHKNELAVLRRLRNRRPKAKIGVTGPFASFKSELFLESADFVIGGEPESAAFEIARGQIPQGLAQGSPMDLDALPFPAWEYFPLNDYSYFPALRERPFLSILSSRGCSYSCGYCPYPVNAKFRERSVDNVLEEIARNAETFGMKAFLFRDPLFTAKKKRARAIADGIKNLKLNLKWAMETRLDLLDEELLVAMREAGLRVLNCGVESADDAVLKGIDRIPVNRKHEARMLALADDLGIRATCFYVLGLPHDDADSIRRTIAYAKRLNTHAAMFYLATPFPGTPYYEAVKNGLATDDFERMDGFTPVVKHPELSEAELRDLLHYAYTSYYYRPRYAWALARRAVGDFAQA